MTVLSEQIFPSSAKHAWDPIPTYGCSALRTEPSVTYLAAHTPNSDGVQAQGPGTSPSLHAAAHALLSYVIICHV